MTRKPATQRDLRDNLRALMADRGLKHRHLAEALDLPTPHVSNRLNAQWFSREEVAKLSELFDLSVDELMGESFFKDDATKHNSALREEARRRQIEKNRAARQALIEKETEEKRVRERSVRALCCSCGALRMVDKTTCGPLNGGKIDGIGKPTSLNRWVGRADCAYCDTETDHAVLRTTEDRDELERNLPKPAAEQIAVVERDQFVERLQGFSIDVRFRRFASKRHRAEEGIPIIDFEFDASKSQWRIEIQTDVPASIQLNRLKRAWVVIAADDKEWWSERDITPEGGCWMYASDKLWGQAGSNMADEITSRSGAERALLAMDIRNEVHSSQWEVS